eukprot:403360977
MLTILLYISDTVTFQQKLKCENFNILNNFFTPHSIHIVSNLVAYFQLNILIKHYLSKLDIVLFVCRGLLQFPQNNVKSEVNLFIHVIPRVQIQTYCVYVKIQDV